MSKPKKVPAMSFAERLRNGEGPLLLYEVVPPDRSAPQEREHHLAEYVSRLLADQAVHAVNVPEIRTEERDGHRVTGLLEKQDPRQFGTAVSDLLDGDVDTVVNHVTVYESRDAQREWFRSTFTDFGIDDVVLVGGESSDVDYPGPGVTEAAALAREVGESVGIDPCLGAITIPSRRREDFDEPERMVSKQRAGIEYFTSQVIYDPAATRALLRDYDAACAEAGVEPATVFLSFAPITGRKDVRFLEWLGVDIPDHVIDWVLDDGVNPTHRSVRVAEHVLYDVLRFVEREELDVPVGLNVEHIMRYNFEASELLLDRLSSLLEWRSHAGPPPAPEESPEVATDPQTTDRKADHRHDD